MEWQEFHVHKVSGMISLGYSMVCFNTQQLYMSDCCRAFSVRCQEEMCSRKILVMCLKKEGVLYNTARADLHQIFHTNNKVSQAVGYI